MSMPLPTPGPQAIKHSLELVHLIHTEIEKNRGKISFARFMELALYAPGLGYYNAGTQKFGRTGDFITAPLLSSLFSQCLANQCQQILSQLNEPASILEIGAGNGQMAADILLCLEELKALPTQYLILELSPDLKQRQQYKIAELCPHLLDKVVWLNTLPKSGFKGVILANEVLDAMPVHRFQIIENTFYELELCVNPNTKAFELKPYITQNKTLLEFFGSLRAELETWPTPYTAASIYTSEVNLNLKPWILSLSDILSAGVILLIDYGFPAKEYYHPDRREGTLMCHYQHQAHSDPFFYPGLQDISAHVDFSAVAEAGAAANLEILGYSTQASFLISCRLIQLLQGSQNNSPKEQALLNSAINVLTSPAEMGELFKVIALGRNIEEALIGFELNDKLHML